MSVRSKSPLQDDSIRYSNLESEVILTDLYIKLNNFHDSEKTKVVTSWLVNSYTDLVNAGSENTEFLSQFIIHVRIFNTLVNNSPFDKATELAECFSRDFLHSFVVPSLTGPNSSCLPEKTYYFQVACENVTQPLLIRRIMELSISHLLPSLISRLKQDNTEVLVSTMSLLKVLLEFYCEDLWYELILQYLLPMKHLLVFERQKAVPEMNYSESTLKFLDLIPGCIVDTLSPEVLSEYFVLYAQQELNRLHDIDSALSKGIPLSKSEVTGIPLVDDLDEAIDEHATENEKRNPTFPLWTFKYDGTDVLYASRKYSFMEPEEYFEDDLFQFMNHSVNERKRSRVSTHMDKSTEEQKSEHERKLSLNSNADDNESFEILKDGLNPAAILQVDSKLENPEESSQAALLGPFLESLFHLLNEWNRVDPEVILMVSELFSLMAASRIPLLSSLILDLSLTLQPCYPSFSGTVHSIRMRLDGSMNKYPSWFIKQAWQKANSATNSLLKSLEQVNLVKQAENNETESLREKVINSAPFSFISKFSRGKSVATFAKLFSQGQSIVENRILSQTASGFGSEEQEMMAKKTAIRCILFTHWLLELGAIAQQICWSQSRRNPRSDD